MAVAQCSNMFYIPTKMFAPLSLVLQNMQVVKQCAMNTTSWHGKNFLLYIFNNSESHAATKFWLFCASYRAKARNRRSSTQTSKFYSLNWYKVSQNGLKIPFRESVRSLCSGIHIFKHLVGVDMPWKKVLSASNKPWKSSKWGLSDFVRCWHSINVGKRFKYSLSWSSYYKIKSHSLEKAQDSLLRDEMTTSRGL